MGTSRRFTLVLVATGLAAGCCFLPSAPAPSPAPTPPRMPVPVPAPSDGPMLDFDPVLLSQVACASPQDAESCAIATALASATAFEGCPSAGQSTFLGVIHAAGGGAPTSAVPFFLQVRPAAGAGPGACEASARVLVAESPEEQADLDAVLAALRAGQPPPEGSGAVAYARTAVPERGYHPLTRTTGVSTLLFDETSLFLRSAPGRVLLVERGAPLVDYPTAHILSSFVFGELWPLP
ncbi:MAG: hypothetical protein U0234_31160 [Sandaracinus sp.]